jgi:cation transport regulator ChaB
MPFANVSDLPERVRDKYGAAGQRAFLAAFNSAWDGTCAERGDERESCAFAVATAAANNVKKADVAQFGKVVKADEEKQILFVPVLVPDVEDTQGDIPPADEIEMAAHRFAKEYASGQAELGLDHETTLAREQAMIVETWIEKADIDYDGNIIPKGTWMFGIHIPDSEIWKSAKEGDRTGASIEGTGFRYPA